MLAREQKKMPGWWPVGMGLAILFGHFWLGWYIDGLIASSLSEKAALFLDALSESADQTLQASHFLEERIVDRLKIVAARIASAPSADALSPSWLEEVRRQNELKGISIYNCHGKIKAANDPALIGTEMPSVFGCHDLVQGLKKEHVFGFSNGIFCETDAFGYAVRLESGDVVRLLTGVDFVLGFEKNAGLPALIERFRKHPGVRRLDLLNRQGQSLLKNSPSTSSSPFLSQPLIASSESPSLPAAVVPGDRASSTPSAAPPAVSLISPPPPDDGFTARKEFALHGAPIGYFEVVLKDEGILTMRRMSMLAVCASGLLALVVLGFLFRLGERRRERQEQEHLVLETRKRIEGLGKVVAAVAHEVRNPLNTLALALEALRADIGENLPPEQIARRFELLEKTLQQANQMIQNLLKTSRPILPQCRPIQGRAWLEALMGSIHAAYPGLELNLEAATESTNEPWTIDPDLLEKTVWNLVQNAAQAGAKGMTIRSGRAHDAVEIQVEDDGAGIAAEIMENLFVPGNTSRPEGSGMGLYNCQRLIQAMNGRIGAVSVPGKTVFTIRIPRKMEAKSA